MFPKKAHSAIICGTTGCGKTEFVLNLLETEYKGFFEYVIVICPTWMYNKAYFEQTMDFYQPRTGIYGRSFRLVSKF